MFALKKILVPTNLGAPSKAAVKYGVAFARQFNAKLYLVHVLDAKELDAAIETERVLEAFAPDAPGPETRSPIPKPLRAMPRARILASCSRRRKSRPRRPSTCYAASAPAAPATPSSPAQPSSTWS